MKSAPPPAISKEGEGVRSTPHEVDVITRSGAGREDAGCESKPHNEPPQKEEPQEEPPPGENTPVVDGGMEIQERRSPRLATSSKTRVPANITSEGLDLQPQAVLHQPRPAENPEWEVRAIDGQSGMWADWVPKRRQLSHHWNPPSKTEA